jgi:alpha-ketoglutarate-dependent 2,4-dichlorophenoxyacetate dioxygenase
VPAKYSLLSGRVLPSWGANTEFADMRAAYNALDARTKADVEDLVCLHSLLFSREAIGFTEMTAEENAAFQPVRQPLVRRHPVTGRRSLFLSAHAGAIEGWTIPEARMFLRDLTEFATQPRFVYSHEWRPFDLVVWDNRQTMHRARRFDRNEVRDVRRTTLAGDETLVGLASS